MNKDEYRTLLLAKKQDMEQWLKEFTQQAHDQIVAQQGAIQAVDMLLSELDAEPVESEKEEIVALNEAEKPRRKS
jgi:hypothetical protein